MIKAWDYLGEFEQENEEVYAALEKVFSSGRLILGESVTNFEAEFSSYCDRKFGVGVNSGTDALFLTLKALDIGEGDEVITVSNTAVPTISAICSTGALARFVDIEYHSYLMKVGQIEKAITKKTKAIICVHLYGQCVDMETVSKIAQKYKLKLIEDCAQSHGATHKNKKCGSMSEAAAFSFYPTKILGGYGDGGMVVTSDEDIYHRLRRLRFYGMEDKYYSLEQGYNSRLDELHAEILRYKLKYLNHYIDKRIFLAKRYSEKLANSSLILPKIATDNKHVFYLYVCRHRRRDAIISELKKRDIWVNINYPWPIHIMSGYSFLGYKPGDFPETEKAAAEIFSLPMYPTLTEQEQDVVCSALVDILAKID